MNSSWRKLTWIGIVLCLMIGLGSVSQPKLTAQEFDSRLLNEERWLWLDTGKTVPQDTHLVKNEVVATEVSDWSNIVFQSYRDRNWEIYRANGSGQAHIRLTNHPASDIHPDLRRGGQEIVFASNRTGNYEIFVMGAGGGVPQQLTSNASDDVNPAWSPDGTQIAFESYRDGQAEIYVMYADGSGQTRLTSSAAYNGYDGEPAWSPDGTKIAFVSTRTGGYRIWVMNADGSDPIQLSGQPYSEGPTWSPDGTRIAYDADGDGDGWQDLWIMNADGSEQKETYRPGSTINAWVGSWSPDGRYVILTHISFIQYQGQWYWTEAKPCIWDTKWGGCNFLYSNQNTDWSPHWQTLDRHPPESYIQTLPTYQRGDVTVGWNGYDSGASGLQSYDVQYRDAANTEWTDWYTHTTTTSANFAQVVGRSYQFRVRARDNAFNIESWPSGDGDAQTTFYHWGILGIVRDNTGTPVIGANASTTPDAFVTLPSNLEGAYATYVASSAVTYTVSWNKSGYGSAPLTCFDGSQDASSDVILPPADDLITNGSFEIDGGTLIGWQLGESLPPTITRNVRPVGQSAAWLGPQSVLELGPVEPSLGREYPEMAAGNDGTIHLVYIQGGGIWYRRRDPQGEWSEPVLIGTPENYHYHVSPSIACSPDGGVYIAWNGEKGAYYSHLPPGGIWSAQSVVGPASEDMIRSVDIVTDDQGGLHLVYGVYTTGYYRYRSPGGTWSDAVSIGNLAHPRIARGPDGTLYVWYKLGNNPYEIVQRDPAGQWQAAQSAPCAEHIAVDRFGTIHAICSQRFDGAYTSKPLHGEWTPLETLEHYYGLAALAVDSEGTVYVIYQDLTAAGSQVYFTYKFPGESWPAPLALGYQPYTGQQPDIVVDHDDNPHLIYQIGFDAFYRTNLRVTETISSKIEQTIAIPSDVHHPILSFVYKLHGTNPNSIGAFDIVLSDDVRSETIYSTTQGTVWQHHWLDVSDWVGKMVTMTFSTQTISGTKPVWLVVDDITLGSSYPDVKLDQVCSPQRIWKDDLITCTLSYENRGGSPAQSVQIAALLPPELLYAEASLTPDSTVPLTWNLGYLAPKSGPFHIVFTTTVASTVQLDTFLSSQASIHTASPELETENNSADATFWTGLLTYLPIVVRRY